MQWTKDEISFLKENYKIKPFKEIAKILNRPISSVFNKANNLRLTIRKHFLFKKWSQEEVNYLKSVYSNHTNSELSLILCRAETSIEKKAQSLNITKSREFIKKIRKNICKDRLTANPDCFKKQGLKCGAIRKKQFEEWKQKDPEGYKQYRLDLSSKGGKMTQRLYPRIRINFINYTKLNPSISSKGGKMAHQRHPDLATKMSISMHKKVTFNHPKSYPHAKA